MTQNSATLAPAGFRDYVSGNSVLADWREGKDFVIHTLQESTYCSIRDRDLLMARGITHLTFRNTRGRILVNVPI
jgi:hypothetical protein